MSKIPDYLKIQQGYRLNVKTITGDTTLTENDAGLILVNNTAAITITLPTASGNEGLTYIIKKISSATQAVTLDGYGSETIDGSATNNDIDAQYDYLVITSDGSNWHIVGRWIH